MTPVPRSVASAVLPLLAIALSACTSAPAAAPAPTTAAAPPTAAAAKPAASPAAIASPSPSPLPAASPSASASVLPSPSPFAGVAPQPQGASLSITSPTNGQTVPAGSVQVTVQYSGPPLAAAASATNLNDYHLHYFLDESATPYLGTQVPVPMGNPRIVHTAALQVTFDNVTAGSHTVVVMLSGANHVSVAPPLSAQVTFTVS